MSRPHKLIAIISLLLLARNAEAQWIDFGIQCANAPFRACASLQVTSVFHEALNSTEVLYRVSNLHGTAGFEGGRWAGLGGIRVFGFEPVSGFWSAWRSNHVLVEGNASAGANLDYPWAGYQTSVDSRLGVGFHIDWGDRLFGCTLGPYWGADALETDVNPYPYYDQTCGGYITYSSLVYGGELRLAKDPRATFYWTGADDAGTTSWNGSSCTTGVDCAQVTPEPVSLLLLGSGLAGIIAARARRRLRRGERDSV